ncbi:SLC13 family permease [Fulvivirga sp. RKSG066]|uniref:SLC13 family permease n=1 Tax=Fulvivirga aurantia TaxID=2529383 RepID=UPI0012BC7FEA|nr:SLC13 family permease [Fulvivirga aurantia]MTI21193.1 SLC13 family permease [Fulvivirga aurantia]
METELIIVFGIVVGALGLFISGIIPIDQTAILIMVSLMITGILTPEEGVSGFSNTATLTVLALLIVSQGLRNTGVVDALGDQMLSITQGGKWQAVLIIMIIAAISSAFINTTAVVAVFIPIMFKISQQTKIKAAILLIPLSFAAMVGGSSTMIGTSTNLLINAVSRANGADGFRIFDLTLMGVILLVALIIYMLFIGIRFLNKKPQNISVFNKELEEKNYITEVLVVEGSELIGEKLEALKLHDKTEYKLLRLIRNNRIIKRDDQLTLRAGDVLTVKTNIHEIINLNNNKDLRILSNAEDRSIEQNEDEDRVLFEALIVPNSNLIGRKVKDIQFNRFYDAIPLAARRGGLMGDQKLMDHVIQVGDILLMDGDNLPETEQSKHDWIVVQQVSRENIVSQLRSRRQMTTSVSILILIIFLAVSNIFPILISAWLGVALMFLTGCLSVKKAYENVEWKVIFLLAGVIPLGTALSKTGGDQVIADFIVNFSSDTSPRFVVSVLFIFTTLLTSIMSNQATAILLVPIAVKVAISMSIPAEPLLIAILFGANTSFITPVGYQTNAMIYGPGNYSFKDFLKVGGGISLIFWILITVLVPIFYM